MPIPAKVQGQAVWGFGEPGLIHWSQTIHEIWNFSFNITAQNHCKIGALNFQKIGLYSIYILAAWLGLHFSIFTANTGRKFFLLNAIYYEVCQSRFFALASKCENVYVLPKWFFLLCSSTGPLWINSSMISSVKDLAFWVLEMVQMRQG